MNAFPLLPTCTCIGILMLHVVPDYRAAAAGGKEKTPVTVMAQRPGRFALDSRQEGLAQVQTHQGTWKNIC